MEHSKIHNYIKNVLGNMPKDWLNLTTHRLDIFDEKLAKVQFLERFESLFEENDFETSALSELPTAYDYIRLGHPLSCILEWVIARRHGLHANNVISFSSKTIPVMAILRKNLLDKVQTQIVYTGTLPDCFDVDVLRNVYGYQFELAKTDGATFSDFNGTTLYISETPIESADLDPTVDFYITNHSGLGSIVLINGVENEPYIAAIQHVRRRETIAMTPANCLFTLWSLLAPLATHSTSSSLVAHKSSVLDSIQTITQSATTALVGSCGLSIQYAISMGLIHHALENHKGKDIKIIVPTNCYGGTNDQARRIAACVANVEVVDLAVDGDNEMVQSIDTVLNEIAEADGVPLIIAEIPTNPRVEVPDLIKLEAVLSAARKTKAGDAAIAPVFILDQTFCPNLHFLGDTEILSQVQTIAYVSGSKFPSGGKCTAGYCVANKPAAPLMEKIETHLKLCDNEATDLQMEILATQMPSMNQRIAKAYANTREFVDFISETLPDAKINFVSKDLAKQGFTPSVFSLDLPTKGNTAEEKEAYKRTLNHKLINLMISKIPNESKHCVSYGQLSGCYWTIPATSTQGTTKEGDKDYIARVSLSPNMDVEAHKRVFLEFVQEI